jgi:histone H2A
MEYLCAEVLELAGNATKDNKRLRVTPRFILLAVKNDEELSTFFANALISQGGVLPYIHAALLPKKKRR